MRPPVAEARWAARSARARELAAARPEARDALEFLARLTEFQQSLAAQYRSGEAAILPYLEWLTANAPAPIARAAAELTTLPTDPVGHPIAQSPRDGDPVAESPQTFIVETLFQVFPPEPCPFCATPVVSLLREAGHGSRRLQVCGVCLTESPAPRLGCPACGEQRVEVLPIFRSDATEPARIEACDTCRAYTKTIDMTRDASACPIADDVASISLDLWAREQGYHRVRPNLLRL